MTVKTTHRTDDELRILYWIPRFWPAVGGAELHTRHLAELLSEQQDVRVLTHCTQNNIALSVCAARAWQPNPTDENLPVEQINIEGMISKFVEPLASFQLNHRLARPAYRWLFNAILSKQTQPLVVNADVVHFVYNGLTESAELACKLAHANHRAFVLTPLVCTDGPVGSAWETRRFNKLYRQASAIVTLTEHEKNWLCQRGVPESKITICPFGPLIEPQADTSRFRQRLSLGDEPIVLFVGRVTEDKGCDLFLAACDQVWKNHPNTQFVLLGPADAAMQKRLSQITDPRVHHINHPDDQTKTDALAACSVMCMPSRAESLGVAYLEAWSFKKAVIALDLPVLREVIGQQRGLLVQESGASVATAIHTLLENPSLADQLGTAGHTAVESSYSWQNCRDTLTALYQRIV